MIGEIKVGMYAKVVDLKDPNYEKIGLVTLIEESGTWPYHDEIISLKMDDGIHKYIVKNEYDDSCPVKIVLSKTYAINWLNSLDGNSNKYDESSSNEDLLSNICLSGCIHDELIDSIIDDKDLIRDEKIEEILNKPRTGKFTTKKEFIGFISAKGNVRFNSNYAYVQGKQLSGMLEGSKFKITIYEDKTIDFEEVDTDMSNPDMIQRLIDDICERDVTGYTKKFIVHGLSFEDDKERPFYLEIEHKKPIDTIYSLFDEEKKEVVLSEKSISILDSLFGDDDKDLNESPIQESEMLKSDVVTPDDKKEDPLVINKVMSSDPFKRMKEEKIQELKERIEKYESDLRKFTFESESAKKRADKISQDLKVLTVRVDSMMPPEPSNGYVFFVSEEKKDMEKDEKLEEVVNRISPHLNLNSEVVIQILTSGYHTIKISKKEDVGKEDKDLDPSVSKDIYSKILNIDPMGKITPISNLECQYRGEMTWHQLVGKMIKFGFEQDPTFDKLSGSNSYESEFDKSEEELIDIEDMNHLTSMEEFNNEEEKIYPPNHFLFSLGQSDNGLAVHLTPRSYWDKNHVQYDGHLSESLDVPSEFFDLLEEVEESTFATSPGSVGIKGLINMLCSMGFLFLSEYQDYITSQYTSYPNPITSDQIIDLINNLYYPNSIIK